jgi:hypothetical protein
LCEWWEKDGFTAAVVGEHCGVTSRRVIHRGNHFSKIGFIKLEIMIASQNAVV